MSQGPKFSISPEDYLYETTTYKAQGDAFLLSVLNSKLVWFLLRAAANSLRGGEWRLRLKRQYIEPLPIPPATDAQKAELATLAEACQAAAEERYRLQQALTRRIPDLAPPGTEPKLNNKLKEWWELPDFAAFRTEVKKALKADIPLAERSDWEDWIARDRAEIARLTADIKANEDRINAIVYELFDLNEEEIRLLEENI